ncbi:MAG: hypothetical protein AAFN07_13990 [Pseudomonadota bacterium]
MQKLKVSILVATLLAAGAAIAADYFETRQWLIDQGLGWTSTTVDGQTLLALGDGNDHFTAHFVFDDMYSEPVDSTYGYYLSRTQWHQTANAVQSRQCEFFTVCDLNLVE